MGCACVSVGLSLLVGILVALNSFVQAVLLGFPFPNDLALRENIVIFEKQVR